MTVLTSEFTHFNLVIHLSTCATVGLAVVSAIFECPRCSRGPLLPFVNCIPYSVKPF